MFLKVETAYNAMLQEQSMAIHYNRGVELLDYVVNNGATRFGVMPMEAWRGSDDCG